MAGVKRWAETNNLAPGNVEKW